MTAFEKAVEFVLAREGGYSNDVHDKGGETNFGISKRAHPDVDIKNLTREQAKVIYRLDYYDKCRCGEMPFPIGFALFDSAVNQGPSAAIRMLQKSLKVTVDGVLGPETMGAIQRANVPDMLCTFVARRAFQYSNHPEIMRYGMGWFTRLAQCHQTAMEPF